VEADLKEAEGRGRPDPQAAEEEDQGEGQDAAQEAAQELVQTGESAQIVLVQAESEMG
jgi:hypothetical protein